MDRYDPGTPRKRLIVVALAASALTVGLLVVAPTYVTPEGTDAGSVAAKMPVAREPSLVVIEPSRIDVIGVREKSVAMTDPATTRDLRFVARQADDSKREGRSQGD